MLKLIAKDYTASAIDYEAGTSIKMMAVNEGRNVAILLDGKTVSVPVDEFVRKMKAAFFEERNDHE